VPVLGDGLALQKPRRLQLNASSLSWPHSSTTFCAGAADGVPAFVEASAPGEELQQVLRRVITRLMMHFRRPSRMKNTSS
jgi:hypothetical protein